MAVEKAPLQMQPAHASRFPWMHVIGYVLSIILTLAALSLVLTHATHAGTLLLLIMLMAVVQIFVQLYFFMHITESHGPAYHVITLLIGLFFTFAIIAGSLWIMSFTQQSY